ncbi:DUF2723 domain-containing protein [Chitinispirillales bacterium ANBcel5]|uniref:glycosyltransferase family 117 protein n=1 Tax=Cellulosispirillum alkaliphilum TaxID=3039283 RepID=UPI002A512781|nr:DUF2723 domain-containing protein [Chitinispirillales bacterium ANBcel5]
MEQVHARTNRLVAAVVFLTAFIAFITSVAPTVAFWDCGEYIAAGHSLGIPHPPGNPLFVLLMRVSSIFFSFFEDVGYRMNFTIVLASALTAVFMYLIVVRVAISYVGIPDTLWKKITVYVGGFVGGLFSVFGYTFWFSAVETSVYNLSMLAIAICTWLILKWYQSTNPYRDRLLVLVAFIGFLGIGLHMYTMIILPPAFLFIILADKEKRRDIRFWATGILMASILYSLSSFLWLGPLTALTLFLFSSVKGENQYKWRFCFWLAFFALIGYSVHLFIPIRSALEPMINEGHPDNWAALIDFLERRQYGQESMIRRMFWRRGALGTQFGIEEHMGFGGFHLTQFFRLGELDTQRNFFLDGFGAGISKLTIYLIPTFFMIFGWIYLYRKNRNLAVMLISLAILTTIGLVFYMNFADGTRPERADYNAWVQMGRQGAMPTVHREVRIRDYFFTAGFMYFGMWIGIAASCLLHALFTSKKSDYRSLVAPVCAALLILSPAIPATTNHALNNRSNDWVAYDYAYNLLMSAEENGIIITNGDNDTFPLWALQEAYGIRQDVRVVNLSLLNTPWYIKQLRDLEPSVPITFSDNDIDDIHAERNPFRNPLRRELRRAGIEVIIPGMENHPILRVQDRMLLNFVDNNRWEKPIYFALTVSDNNFMGLGPYLQNQGLVSRIMPETVSRDEQFDLERTLYLLDNVYQFRSLGEDAEILNTTSKRLLSNYASIYLQTTFHIRHKMNDIQSQIRAKEAAADQVSSDSIELLRTEYNQYLETAIRLMDECSEMMPWDWRPRGLRHEILMENDMEETALERMIEAIDYDPQNQHYQQMLRQAQSRVNLNEETTETPEPDYESYIDSVTEFIDEVQPIEQTAEEISEEEKAEELIVD